MARKKPQNLIEVAVMAAIRSPLTYRVPEGVEVRAGQRVLVPLGPREARGIALERVARPAPGFEIRGISKVLDAEPLLSPELLTLGIWMAEYYLAPIGEVFSAMLPVKPQTRRVRLLNLTESGRRKLEELATSLLDEARGSEEAALLAYIAERAQDRGGVPFESVRQKFRSSGNLISRAIEDRLLSMVEATRERTERKAWGVRLASGPLPEKEGRPLSPVGKRIIEALEAQGQVIDHRELLKSARASLAALKNLQRAGRIELAEGTRPNAAQRRAFRNASTSEALSLTSGQSAAFTQLAGWLEAREFSAILLHGVTASGKTELYLRLIARCLELGHGALMLVPEIALTPAVEAQFLARFGEGVAVLHSGLTESERHEEWWRIRRGEARVVLGTRSAIFAPLEDVGLIIVDEEHDPSYKQGETPRYHGRDVAVVRARLSKALVVLGSATPSLESAWNAEQGKYRLVKLEERVGGHPLASVEIVDMREEFRETFAQVPISRRLKQEIEAQLSARAQTMILLNRRGYSWFLLCRSCGQTRRCVNCSISLTYHRREHRLLCHYCGYSAAVPSRCPECGSEYLQFVGEGTEKLEDKFAEIFPGARVARLDRDVARRSGQFARILSEFEQGKIDILVGTQMISKGHDFPAVTLVGVVSVDTGLSLPDFRAAERTFQLLTQAAGRAGRGEAPGRVLVQTFYPEHYAVRMAAEQNYERFYAKEMSFRRVMHYPPVTALASVIAQDVKLKNAARIASQVGGFLTREAGDAGAFRVLGPSPAPRARIEGRYRIQCLVKSKSRARLNGVLQRLVAYCDERGIPPRALSIDVDPVSIL